MSERNNIIMDGLKISGLGLEIGPSHNPIAPKKLFNIHILDHLDKEGLLEKYKDFPVDLSRIEEVDFIFDGRQLNEITPHHYDYVIASHVIEHVPNFIKFLSGISLILNDSGCFSIAVPDKRYCFDYLKPLTQTADVIDAYFNDAKRHPVSAIFEAYAMAVKNKKGEISWVNEVDLDQLEPCHSIKEAFDIAVAYSKSTVYHDVHRWKFTPKSFLMLMIDLNELDLTELVVSELTPTINGEFFAKLIKRSSKYKSKIDLMALK
jgi:hypothetical protein